jgi:hypothetical protein
MHLGLNLEEEPTVGRELLAFVTCACWLKVLSGNIDSENVF